MKDQRREAEWRCVHAFTRGDYHGCIAEAFPLMPQAQIWLAQLVIISLQRLGLAEHVKDIGGQALHVTANDPWEHALVQLTLGLTDLPTVLALAQDATQRCRAHYYAGARLMTDNRHAEALTEFTSCVAIGAQCLEAALAKYPLRELPAVELSGRDAQRDVVRLNVEVVKLHEKGEYGRALELSMRACTLAEQHLGKGHPDHYRALSQLASVHEAIGDYAAALPLHEQGLVIARSLWKETDPRVAHALERLAKQYHALGNYAAAEVLLRQAVEIMRQAFGESEVDPNPWAPNGVV